LGCYPEQGNYSYKSDRINVCTSSRVKGEVRDTEEAVLGKFGSVNCHLVVSGKLSVAISTTKHHHTPADNTSKGVPVRWLYYWPISIVDCVTHIDRIVQEYIHCILYLCT